MGVQLGGLDKRGKYSWVKQSGKGCLWYSGTAHTNKCVWVEGRYGW